MSTTVAPYPLCWPAGVARTPGLRRVRSSPFRTTFPVAVNNVADSLRKFQKDAGVKIEHVILSSNVDLVNRTPQDPGAAAWFKMDEQFVAFGVDRYRDVAANVQAIHHIIEARRTELRYGGLAIVRQTFRAFLALPSFEKAWWDVLQCRSDASVEVIRANYSRLARDRHPDRPTGSTEAMAELNAARDAAIKGRC